MPTEREIAQEKTIEELTSTVNELQEQVAYLKKMLFGQKTEKTDVVFTNMQLNLFNEAEDIAKRIDVDQSTIPVKGHGRKPKRTHDELLKELPIEEVIHNVIDRNCDICGSEMAIIGKEFVRDELVYEPAKLYVRKHYQEIVKCIECGSNAKKDASLPDIEKVQIKKAKAPVAMIPKSFCSPELLAHIIFNKYLQSVPLYRQEKEFQSLGFNLSRTTIANWIIYAADKWAKPVYAVMKQELLKSPVIHADETTVQVLKEEGKKASTKSRMWVYTNPFSAEKTCALFEYHPGRGGKYAKDFLGDYSGYLVCDGFDGYNKPENTTRCGCFAHVRRKFVEALGKEEYPDSVAATGVAWINKLYDESKKEEDKRQERLKAVLDGFYLWLDGITVAGKSNLAKAVQYAQNERKYLYNNIEEEFIPLDNNRAEQFMKAFVTGRKNWLFSDTVKGADASALFYSLVLTAHRNGLNVEKYLTELFRSDTLVMPW